MVFYWDFINTSGISHEKHAFFPSTNGELNGKKQGDESVKMGSEHGLTSTNQELTMN